MLNRSVSLVSNSCTGNFKERSATILGRHKQAIPIYSCSATSSCFPRSSSWKRLEELLGETFRQRWRSPCSSSKKKIRFGSMGYVSSLPCKGISPYETKQLSLHLPNLSGKFLIVSQSVLCDCTVKCSSNDLSVT